MNLFPLHFRGNTVFDAASCLLGCLPDLSDDDNQPSATAYTLLGHDCFDILTNVDLIAFVLIRIHVCA